MSPSRPILRYHGGKWRIAPWIINHFPPHGRYVEPFGGGASVLLRKQSALMEVYNDLDDEIVNVFRVLRDLSLGEELRQMLFLTPFARSEYALSRKPADNPVEMARRTIVRSFMGHGGNAVTARYNNGFRGRREGYGPNRDFANYSDCVPAFVNRMRRVVIECMPALDLIPIYDTPCTLFYVDPPYLPETRTASGACYRHEMTLEQHRQLAEVLRSVHGMVILSGYDSPLYRELYADWEVDMCSTRGEKASPRTEVLWISPKTRQRTLQRSLLEIEV
jgi:DNA adenine methylase